MWLDSEPLITRRATPRHVLTDTVWPHIYSRNAIERMKAVVWHGPRRVSVDEVSDPVIENSNDAIIKVEATAICGSDLHLYDHGLTLAMKPGDILGHETLGTVVETGPDVDGLRVGDRVVVPFNISCGSCFFCTHGLQSQCERTQNVGGRKGAALFGYTHLYGGVPGGQAEYLRVPEAQYGPIKIDPAVPAETAVLLADVLPTAWQAVQYADLRPGQTIAVFGLGPVGQMCTRIAKHLGAEKVIGVDMVPSRLAAAAEHGVITVDATASKPGRAIHHLTEGRGADAVIDAVGMDAEGSHIANALQTIKVQPDRLTVLHDALGAARRGGTVSVIGVYSAWVSMFPLGDLFDKQITLRWGQANVRRWTDELLTILGDGDPIDASSLVSNVVPLDEAPQWYQRFHDREDGVHKVMLRPNGSAPAVA